MRQPLSLLRRATMVLLATATVSAFAQNFPSRPVTIVVPFSAGGATDSSARLVAQLLTKQLGQSFVVENRTGASGMIGMAYVARSAPDGYTLGWGGNSPMTVAPHLSKNPPYDPTKAFKPVSLGGIGSWTLVARPGLGVKTMAELLDKARANPGKMTFASSGIGSAPHLLGEMLKASAKIDLLHVPYKGEADGFAALLAGQVDLMLGSTPASTPLVKAGRLTPLAVTTPKRDGALPDVPTASEAGVADLTFELFFGLVAPAGTPAPVVAKLAAAMKEAVSHPSYREAMEKVGFQASSSTPEAFNDLLTRHNQRWLSVIRSNNISTE